MTRPVTRDPNHDAPARSSDARSPRPRSRKGLIWAMIPVAVFAIQGTVLAITMSLATGPGYHAVEPDYYEQSIEWDERAERLRAAERLGWSLELDLPNSTDHQDQPGARRVTARITDRAGADVQGARLSVELFHHATAGERTRVDLSPTDDQAHAAPVPTLRPGLWEVRVHAQRGDDRCLFVRDFEVEG